MTVNDDTMCVLCDPRDPATEPDTLLGVCVRCLPEAKAKVNRMKKAQRRGLLPRDGVIGLAMLEILIGLHKKTDGAA